MMVMGTLGGVWVSQGAGEGQQAYTVLYMNCWEWRFPVL